MSAAAFSASGVRDQLTAAIASGRAPHLRPIFEACRDYGIAWATVPQKAGKFTIPTGRPAIVILGDDMHEALGPGGFHARSLRRFVATCEAAVIVSCAPDVRLYEAAASMPVVARRNAVLIETRIEREAEWLGFLQDVNPIIRLLLGTVKPEGAVH